MSNQGCPRHAAGDQEVKENVAAGVFAVCLAAVAGFAGLLIAAVAVGVERAWNGRASRRGAGGPDDGGWWREQVADQEAWLARDRAERRAYRKARREWLTSGADPATCPPQRSRGRRFGSAMRRAAARLAVAADRTASAASRFARGCRAGWAAARKARRNGAGFVDTIRAGREDAQPDPQPAAPPTTDPTTDTAAPATDQTAPATDQTAPATDPDTPTEPEPAQPAPTQEAPVSHPINTPPPAGAESHADLAARELEELQIQLDAVNEHADALAARRNQIQATIARINERVTANGGTDQTRQAVDAASAVVTQLGQHVGAVSDTAVQAADLTSAARVGVDPALKAQDQLAAAGASGQFVAPATT